MDNPKVSIIVPCKSIDSFAKKCIEKCLKLNYTNYEIIILPDKKNAKIKSKKINVIETGEISPALKRNIGMRKSKGEFFAFIDSDAYPKKDWLKNAMRYFEDKKIGIVGGPNLTPAESNFWEKISGYSLGNYFCSGPAHIRYRVSKNQFVKELPSCNYISRKKASSEYDSCFLTAEDSQFCFTCHKKGYKILYAKDVIVYHHRRNSFGKHIKQMFIYGRDIAWLTKKNFSFDKMYYSLLSLFVVGFFIGFVAFLHGLLLDLIIPIFLEENEIQIDSANKGFLVLMLVYSITLLITSIHENAKISTAVFVTTIGTHFAYGVGWLYGILKKQKVMTF